MTNRQLLIGLFVMATLTTLVSTQDAYASHSPPVITSVVPTNDGAIVNWTQASSGGFGSEFRVTSDSYFEVVASGSSGTATITGLECGTEYEVEVETEWEFRGDRSDTETYTTLADEECVIPPPEPECVNQYNDPIITSITPTIDGAEITWIQDQRRVFFTCFDPLSFTVTSDSFVESDIEGDDHGTTTITGLECGTEYDVEVKTFWRSTDPRTDTDPYETLACLPEHDSIWCETDGDIVRGGTFLTTGTCGMVFAEEDISDYFEVEIEGDLDLIGDGRCRDASTELIIYFYGEESVIGTITIESNGESCRNPPVVNGEHLFIITGATGIFANFDSSGTLETEMDRFRNFDIHIHGILVVEVEDEKKPSGGGCEVAPTFGTPFTCAVRNFVDDGVTIHGVSYDPEGELHIKNPQIDAVVGTPYSIELKPYESHGEANIKWVAVALGLVEGDFVFGNAEALIFLHQSFDGTFTIEEDDENNIVRVIDFVKSRDEVCAVEDNDALCPVYRLDYSFDQAPIGNMVGVQVVNQDRSSESRFFNDGIDVTGDSLNPSPIIEVLAKEKFVSQHYLTYTDPSFKDRTVAIDENGKTWYKQSNGVWYTEYVMPDRSCKSTSTGYAKHCPEFDIMMQGQELVAQYTLDTMYPNINRDEPFSEIDQIFAYEYSSTSQREQTLQTLVWYNAN